MPVIIGVRFKPVEKIYYFSPEGEEYKEHDPVIVETARGIEFARVAVPNKEITEAELKEPLKPVLRRATEEDLQVVAKNASKKDEALQEIKKKVEKHELDMKIVDCEYTFDGNKLIIYFTAEGRVDFRELVKDLASIFKIRIELRQIGIRDESKMRGGLASCGRGCCCSQHLSEFAHVSIKMAKTQGLSLNPTKISGLCGRLMCCLEYENPHYAESSKLMPKLGSEVVTSGGKATVVSNNLLKHIVRTRAVSADGTIEIKDYPLAELKGFKKFVPDENDESDDEKDILS